ncbi:hypothetical protein Hanom_Chr15g01402411 [Helianthus anomalus]
MNLPTAPPTAPPTATPAVTLARQLSFAILSLCGGGEQGLLRFNFHNTTTLLTMDGWMMLFSFSFCIFLLFTLNPDFLKSIPKLVILCIVIQEIPFFI